MTETAYIPALRYNRLTRFYDFFLGITFPETKIKRALIEQCMFSGAEQVLDFVGTATLSLMIKPRYPLTKVTGIDVDIKILGIANNNIAESKLDIKVINFDGSNIPFPDGYIDKVVSSLVFHHIPTENKKTVLKEIYRILKHDGELHIADFCKENTKINSKGLLPGFIEKAGFTNMKETKYFNTLFGTVKLISAIKK